MKSLEELTHIVAKNLTYYRKLNHLTQLDLAEKISYSDKAISKWERAEALPDVYILTLFADIFHITVNDLLTEKSIKEIEHQEKEIKKSFLYNKFVISLLAAGLVLFIAVVLFAFTKIIAPKVSFSWLYFIDALPIISIIYIVFSKLYWKPWARFISISFLNWSLALAIYLSLDVFFNIKYLWMLFIIAAAFEVLVIFWYLRKRKK